MNRLVALFTVLVFFTAGNINAIFVQKETKTDHRTTIEQLQNSAFIQKPDFIFSLKSNLCLTKKY